MKERGVGDAEGGDHERQGTVWSATAHIVAAVIGSGVLALAWSVAQLGWIFGPLVLLGFSCVTYYTSTLLADCYRYPDPITGTINHAYMDAVRAYLGPREVSLCGCAQYVNLWGTMVGYTITASTSMIAVKRVNCFHRHGDHATCGSTGTVFMLIFGMVQLVLSQFPSLENITWLSVVAVVTSFAYSFISLGLCIAKWISHGDFRGGLAGTHGSHKLINVLLALGNVAFAYTFADVFIEIQNTLKSPPPENRTMKKATFYGISLTTIFYMALGCTGYAAFGNTAPGNILTGGFQEPFWLVDLANICVIIHLVGAYQVYAQPMFARFEETVAARWPNAKFIHRTYTIRVPFTDKSYLSYTLLKLVFRSALIMLTTLVSLLLPLFNAILGIIGALSFWPLSVYFPVRMHVKQNKISRGSSKWLTLQGLSMFCLLISIAAGIGSVADIVHNLKLSAPFKTVY
ncbi:putative amino acid transporter, transmembrane domain-containing protein [Dioscorea sansibarensis]